MSAIVFELSGSGGAESTPPLLSPAAGHVLSSVKCGISLSHHQKMRMNTEWEDVKGAKIDYKTIGCISHKKTQK